MADYRNEGDRASMIAAHELKLSVAIPYSNRLPNLRVAFEGLARQTMERRDFEVIVGVMGRERGYFEACREFADRMNIVSIVSSEPFEIPRARNMAMRQARGQVIVQMDADTLLQPNALQSLYDRYFAFAQQVCVVGQVVGYGNNEDGDVLSVDERPYTHYEPMLERLAAGPPTDPRFTTDHVIPWAFAWTGLIALPRKTVRHFDLFFDEDFHGWGVDDLEWGLRISETGTPIVLRPDICAIHLPHTRNTPANRIMESANYRVFARKWPRLDVELAYAFGDMEANRLYETFRRELATLVGESGRLGSFRGLRAGRNVLVLGTLNDRTGSTDSKTASVLHELRDVESVPFIGLALPYDDATFHECRIMPSICKLSPHYVEAIGAEASRVAQSVTWDDGSPSSARTSASISWSAS